MEIKDRKIGVKSFSGAVSSEDIFGDEKLVIQCPICGCQNAHFEKPEMIDGNDNYQANWGGRGDLIVIPMWNECGHKWEVCIGFHKGTTGIFVIKTGSYTFDENGNQVHLDENGKII